MGSIDKTKEQLINEFEASETELKEVEEALRQSEERYRVLERKESEECGENTIHDIYES